MRRTSTSASVAALPPRRCCEMAAPRPRDYCVPFVLSEADRQRREADVEERRPTSKNGAHGASERRLRRPSTSASVAALPPPRSGRTVEGGAPRISSRLVNPSGSSSSVRTVRRGRATNLHRGCRACRFSIIRFPDKPVSRESEVCTPTHVNRPPCSRGRGGPAGGGAPARRHTDVERQARRRAGAIDGSAAPSLTPRWARALLGTSGIGQPAYETAGRDSAPPSGCD